jgi:hypothetical protein
MKKYLLSAFFCCLLPAGKTSAQNYPESEIPAGLKQNANAVVRESSEEFIQQDLYNATYKVTYILTVLNGRGDDYADFHIYEDNFHELKDFSGELFNALGKSIKKIKRKDLTSSGLSPSLATDGKHTFYDLYAPLYPFTIKYVYEIKLKNGVLSYPSFLPVPGFNVAVEKANYLLKIPSGFVLREKKSNTDVKTVTNGAGKEKTFYYSVENLNALPHEPYAPSDELFPRVYLSPEKFCAEKVCGDLTSWETFGLWSLELLKGRDDLPQKTIDKVNELTKDVSDTREKVKILYRYLQNTTHYVSIQLGIGGWQPMTAEEVARTGFGDCKGLSNYMKALLATAGIPSHYTVIRLDKEKKRLMSDFPNFIQANHVILCVPLAEDTVWLECTSQILPFGYVHSSIAGHDALVVREKDAVLQTLPDYPDEDSKGINSVNIHLSANGDAAMDVCSRYALNKFEDIYLYMYRGMTSKEETDFLASLLRIPKPRISNITKMPVLSEQPSMTLSFAVSCEEYASKTGSRMFTPLNPARTSMPSPTGKNRQYDMVLHFGLNQTDTVRIHLPENYRLESKLQPVEFSSPYGSFKSETEEKDGVIVYIQHIKIARGRFPASEFEAVKSFYEKIENMQSGKITLKSSQ